MFETSIQKTQPTDRTLGSNETYFQRMRRLQGTQNANLAGDVAGTSVSQPTAPAPRTAPQPAYGNGTPYTPVTGNGKIPEPPPAPSPGGPAPAPAPAPAPPPPPKTREQIEAELGIKDMGNNLVFVPSYGGMVDRNNPIYTNLVNPKLPSASGGTGGGGETTGPNSVFHVDVPKLGELPPSYQGTLFDQYLAPDHEKQNQQELALVSRLLEHPETLSPEIVTAMKQKAVEDSLSQQHQLDQQAQDDAAARGFSLSGGQAEAAKRRNAEALQKAILGSNRDLDIRAASQNRQDILNALEQGERILSGQTARSSDIYNSTLKGQGATAADRQAVSNSAIQRAIQQFTGNMDSAQFDLGQQEANRDDYYRGKGLDLQRELGVGGLNIDQQRVNNQSSQFDKNYGLNILQLLEQMREHDNNSGFNWASLNQNASNNAINTLRSMGLL